MRADSNSLKSLMESLFKEAIDKHRNHDALMVAVLAYLESRGRRDKDYEKGALGLIQTTASIIEAKQGMGTQSCSFCGEKPPKVKLGAGGNNSYICNSCVDLFYENFHKNPK